MGAVIRPALPWRGHPWEQQLSLSTRRVPDSSKPTFHGPSSSIPFLEPPRGPNCASSIGIRSLRPRGPLGQTAPGIKSTCRRRFRRQNGSALGHRRPAPAGRVAEWLKAPDSKSGLGAILTGVRIPPLPPACIDTGNPTKTCTQKRFDSGTIMLHFLHIRKLQTQ